MAKSSGITTTINIDDSGGTARNVSNDIFSFDVSTPTGLQDITGLDKSAIERLGLLKDGQFTLNGGFNPAATTGLHTVLRTVSSTDVTRTVTILYNTTPTATLAMEMKFSDYTVNRGADGSLGVTATAQLADGTQPTWT